MCGICGVVYRDPRLRPTDEMLRAMTAAIRHRGPDDEGVYLDGPVGLGHRRLSILDLSPAGHQPMSNEDGTIWIAFNGEIYNFAELRKELEARHAFRSQTDTEVLIHLYEESGPAMVERLDGMFAFAIWDSRRQTILLARDPFGIKPLYFAFDDQRLVFGSELKAVTASDLVADELDRSAIADFFELLWIPAPRSIYRDVKKLPHATTWTLELRDWKAVEQRYWKPEYRPREGRTLDQWADDVEAALTASVRSQLIADVPLGSFLSGGIDSSLVSRAASQASSTALRTFTIDFDERSHSERPYAEFVAERLGASATYRRTEPAALATLPRMSDFYDEPFADASLLPTFAVSAATREFVTVALSGDGGDELFSGYPHHALAAAVSRLDAIPTGLLKTLLGPLARFSPVATRGRDWSERLALDPDRRRMATIRLPNRSSRSELLNPELRQSPAAREWYVDARLESLKGLPPVTQTQLYDLDFYLPNDMLVKVDRASMANGLEVRVPFLTKRMADVAFGIPEHQRYVRGEDKRVLRKIAARGFGDDFAKREKRGFAIPLKRWMREAASPECELAIQRSAPMQAGILDPAGVARLFKDIRRGSGRWHVDRSEELFAILCFDAWWTRYRR